MVQTERMASTEWTAQMVRTVSALTTYGSQRAIPNQLKIS